MLAEEVYKKPYQYRQALKKPYPVHHGYPAGSFKRVYIVIRRAVPPLPPHKAVGIAVGPGLRGVVVQP
jgi:hypothetical protein